MADNVYFHPLYNLLWSFYFSSIEASYFDQINMTKNRLEFDRKNSLCQNLTLEQDQNFTPSRTLTLEHDQNMDEFD